MLVPKVKLLTSCESADLTGVSIDTINQYRDFGLLKVQNIQGTDYFEEDDIKLIFNSRMIGQKKISKEEPLRQSNRVKFEDKDLPTLSSILKQHEAEIPKDETVVRDAKIVRIHADKVSTSTDLTERTEETLVIEEPKFIQGEVEEGSRLVEGKSYVEADGPSSIEILELSRSLKQQLELVLSERDWLRQRVEKLEVQLERQQMISMTETETLRIMAKTKEEKPSPWSFLLSWTQPKK